MGRLIIKGQSVGMLGANCYIVMDEDNKQGFIIDPGGHAKRVLETARALGLDCLGILCTHGHMDHVGAVGKVAEETGAPVYISEADSGALTGSGVKGIGDRLGSLLTSKPNGVHYLEPGAVMPFGDQELKVLATPGHSPGSLSFLVGDNLFCGDLIFQGSIGRTDLRGSSLTQLLESVRREVFVLPPGTRIRTGHGPSTTVGAEMSTNPYLRDLELGV